MLSRSSEYALRAVIWLAAHENGPRKADSIAEALGLPGNYLSKILHRLAQEGVLSSRRGQGGGFRLERPPADLPLAAVIDPFDELASRRRCLLGRESCRDDAPCAAHDDWKRVYREVRTFFEETTVADLIGGQRRSEAVSAAGADGDEAT